MGREEPPLSGSSKLKESGDCLGDPDSGESEGEYSNPNEILLIFCDRKTYLELLLSSLNFSKSLTICHT